MAYVDLIPASFSPTFRTGVAMKLLTPIIKDRSGTPVDFSGWDSTLFTIVAPGNGPTTSKELTVTTVQNADGTLAFLPDSSTFALGELGTAQLCISGKPTSGDAYQLIAAGTLTIAAGR